MAARIDAYVDTSAFIAFMDASDTYQLPAPMVRQASAPMPEADRATIRDPEVARAFLAMLAETARTSRSTTSSSGSIAHQEAPTSTAP